MARLEDVLPALREGKRIKKPGWHKDYNYRIHKFRLINSEGFPVFLDVQDFGDNWEIVPEPTRVADYLVANTLYHTTAKGRAWFQETHPIGQQPEGSVMVPGSERNQE